jgi:uncharacterized repeat protein (TIGR01451 family)/MYXO-CTERM domain-containing protein
MQRVHLTILACIGALATAATADASELRFSKTAAGNVTATGNTLGLAKGSGVNAPGDLDGIGTFISLDGGLTDGSYPAGTTADWRNNGSTAELRLQPDAEVLYAELVWGGSYAYGTENVAAELDGEVTLAFGNEEISVAPDPTTQMTLSGLSTTGTFEVNYYMRSADVTTFVANHLGGLYSASGIPATQDDATASLSAAGWTLVVAYRDSNEPVRNLTVFVGGGFVDEFAVEDYQVDGFCTPPQGDFAGYAAVSTMEGDANRDGDSLAIAPTDQDAFVALSGVNNPADNFFASQINDGSGMVDTVGTFGEANHTLGQNVVGARQGWDITRVPLRSADAQLFNGQTSAVLRTQTSDDSYFPTTVAFSIGVNAPDFSGAVRDFAPDALAIDDTSTVTIDMDNAGLVDATGLVFSAPLPAGLELVSFAVDGVAGDINGNPVDDATLESGVPLGDVAVNGVRELEIVVRSTSEPANGADHWVISPEWTYDYISCVGEPALTEPFIVSDILIDYLEPMNGTTGDGGTTGDDDSDSDSDTEVEPEDDSESDTDVDSDSDGDSDTVGLATPDDGCGCRSNGRDGAPAGMLGLMLLALVRRRLR